MKNLMKMNDQELVSHVEGLIREKIEEGVSLDYKATITLDSEGEKRELVKDLSGFANEIGGALVIGVPETKNKNGAGIPNGNLGIERIKDFENRVQQILRNGCAPMLPASQVREIELPDGKFFYIIQHPQSWMEPHMVTIGGVKRYYRRVGHNTIPMAEHEVDAAYARRSQRAITVDRHIKQLKKATDLMQGAKRILKTTFVPIPIRQYQFDFASPEGRQMLRDSTLIIGSGGNSWTSFGECTISYANAKDLFESKYVATLHPCGSFRYENCFLENDEQVPAELIARLAFAGDVRKFLQKWIETASLAGRAHLRFECLNLGPGKLVSSSDRFFWGFEGPRPELFLEKDICVEMEIEIEEIYNNPDHISEALLTKLLRLIGTWDIPNQ